MSFSKLVKKELSEIRENSPLQKKILLYGLIYGLRINKAAYIISLENTSTIRLFKKILPKDSYKLNDKSLVIHSNYFKDIDSYINYASDDKSSGIFLRGVFISAGRVSDPELEYHLEITPPTKERTDILALLINERGIRVKTTERKNQKLLYIKESDSISDFLAYIGAVHKAMDIINAKIYKELRNNVNRVVNCETANLEKTTKAAICQIEDINYIISLKGMEFLDEDLRVIAKIRLENVDMTLKEIGELSYPKLSRSGVNHRFNRIKEIAKKLRAEHENE